VKPPAPEPPIVLALLRIAVAGVILLSSEPAVAHVVAARPAALWIAPEGLGWLGTVVPLHVHGVAVGTAVLRVSAGLVLAGALVRLALPVLAASLLYVFGAAQLTGTVTHDMHLFWFVVLLAFAPAADALSLDAWARGAPLDGGPATTESTAAAAIARSWLGAIYFFPGLHKVGENGLRWITSDNLKNQMYFKWYEAGGVAPWPRIDRVPGLVNVLAGGVVVFELAMPLLVLSRRTRPWAIAAGFAFHLGAGHFMDVLFPSLIVCYVVLLPGAAMRALVVRFRRPAAAQIASRRALRAPLVAVGIAFGSAIVVQGLRAQTQGWPFACYPTFATLAPDRIVDLAVDVTDARGQGATFRLARRRRQDEWGTVWRLAGLYGDPIDPARLRAFATTLVPPPMAAAAVETRVLVEIYDVRPEAWLAPPLERHVASAWP
jgi:hypothetical protein